MEPFTSIELGPLDQLQVRVEPSPGASLLSLVADSVLGFAQGVDPQWSRGMAGAVAAGDRELVRSCFGPPLGVLPDCLSPSLLGGERTVDAYLARIADCDPEVIVSDVRSDFGAAGMPPRVARLLENPRRLRDAFRRLMAAAWTVYAPAWSRAQPTMTRERERLGTSVVTGTLDCALCSLGPRNRLIGERLCVPDPRAERLQLGDRKLILVPLASGERACLLSVDDPGRVWVGYPITSPRVVSSSDDVVEQVFGAARAEVLRQSATNPSMGDLAGALGAAPGAATYHCGRLEAAGLIERIRVGGRVHVRRTARGDQVVELLT